MEIVLNGNGEITHRDYKDLVFSKESKSAERLLYYARNDYEKLNEETEKKLSTEPPRCKTNKTKFVEIFKLCVCNGKENVHLITFCIWALG